MRTRLLGLSAVLSLFVALAAVAPSPALAGQRSQDGESVKEVYTGTLIGIGGPQAGRSATFTLTLNDRTSRTAAGGYANLLRTKGQDALLKQLQGKDVGTFSLAGYTGQRVNFAYETDTPEGKKLTILFERWLQPFELRYGTRSQEYPFTYMELSIDKDGKGNGTMIGAAKVYFEKDDPSTLNVENFSVYPLRVVNVEMEH